MANTNWKAITIWATIIAVVLIILIGLLVGLNGLKSFFKFIVVALLIGCFFGGVVYVVWLLFIKQTFKDIPYQFKQKLLSVTKVMKNDMLGNLFLSGDNKHNKICLGKYFYLRINLPKIKTEKGGDNKDANDSEAIPIDCFIVEKKGFLDKIFSEPFVILVRPEDHNYSSIFNDVILNGFNLVPMDNQFFTIDRRNLDLDMQKGLNLNYIRESVYDTMKDLDRLVKMAMNLDQKFQKDKERAREFEIPSISGMLGGDKK